MKILVVGAGAVGQTLAQQLSSERHLVTIVDRDPEVGHWLTDRVDAMFIEGNGGSAAVLEKAGVQDADLLLAVTSSDEVNILACMVGNHYGVKTKIARIRNQDYVNDLQRVYRDRLPIELIINPEGETAADLARVLRIPVARYVAEFADGELQLIGFRAEEGSPIVTIALEELRAMYTGQSFIVCALARGDNVIVPRGGTEVLPGDDIFVMVRRDAINLVNALGGKTGTEKLQRVVLLGGGRIGTRLARELEDDGVEVILIDSNAARCERLTAELKRVTVIHGDGTDLDLLIEVGVEHADGFVATTSDDETNILSSVQVKRLGHAKVAAVTRKAQYSNLIASTGLIDTATNPNIVTADAMTRFVRQGKVMSLSSLGAMKAQVIEYIAEEGSAVVGTPLKDLVFPANSVIAAIITGQQVRTPSGEDLITDSDRVIVAVHESARDDVDKMFGRKGWFR